VKLIRQGVITQKPRNGRTSLLSLNLAAIERFRRVEQGGTNPSPKHQSTERPPPLENQDDFPQPIFEKLVQYFPTTSPERLAWAVHLVRSRAKTAPRTLAYFRRALPRVFENLATEVESWLIQEAIQRLRQSKNGFRLPDLAEEMKCAAAANGLPYNGEIIGEAIARACRKLEDERRLASEIHIGKLSPTAPEVLA
jgi:hypothetical protein